MSNQKVKLVIFTVLSMFFIVQNTLANERDVYINTIVIDKNISPWIKPALQELQYYMQGIGNGRKLPVVNKKDLKFEEGNIFLGKSALPFIDEEDLKKLKFDGYIIAFNSGNVGIYGNKSGILFGVYGFLQRIGVKIYTRNVVDYPISKRIPVSTSKIIRNPAFEFRYLGSGSEENNRSDNFSSTCLGFSAVLDDFRLGVMPKMHWIDPSIPYYRKYHTGQYLMSKKKFFKKHPEYFARDKFGKPKKKKAHLCLSNKDVRRITQERLLNWIKTEKESTFFEVDQDDFSTWCECPECKALDYKKTGKIGNFFTGLSDRWYNYLNPIANKVAELYPDKIITTLAYTPATQAPPLHEKIASNIRVLLCPYATPHGAPCHSHDLSCPLNKWFMKDFNAWLKLYPDQLYIFDYNNNFSNRFTPFFPHVGMAKKIKFYNKKGIKGISYCGIPRLFKNLFLYVQGKLTWDPTLNVKVLEEDFINRYYGVSAPYMQELFDYLSARVNDKSSPVHMTLFARTQSQLVDNNYIKKVASIFKNAEKVAINYPEIQKRIEYDKFSALLWAAIENNVLNTVNEKFLYLRESIKTLRKIRVGSLLIGGKMIKHIQNKFHFTIIPNGTWYDADVFSELIACDTPNKISTFIATHVKKIQTFTQENGQLSLNLNAFEFNKGGWGPAIYKNQCEARKSIGLYGTESMQITFKLKKEDLKGYKKLLLSALDDDKPGQTPIRVLLNQQEVYIGKNEASEFKWTDLIFELPKNCLKTGNNTLFIVNRDENIPQQNWIMFSKLILMTE